MVYFYINLFLQVAATSVYFDITIYNTNNKDYGTRLASITWKHTNFDSGFNIEQTKLNLEPIGSKSDFEETLKYYTRLKQINL